MNRELTTFDLKNHRLREGYPVSTEFRFLSGLQIQLQLYLSQITLNFSRCSPANITAVATGAASSTAVAVTAAMLPLLPTVCLSFLA